MSEESVRSSHPLEALIEMAFDRRTSLSPVTADPTLLDALNYIMSELNNGYLRVAEKRNGAWVTNEWIKKAVLLYFRTHDNSVLPGTGITWFDKVPVRFNGYTTADFLEGGFRVVPRQRSAPARSSAATWS